VLRSIKIKRLAPWKFGVAVLVVTLCLTLCQAVLLNAAAGDTASTELSTPAEISLAQQHLRFIGYDIPETSGAWDVRTKVAVMRFQYSIGLPMTGVLTREQLQMLFNVAATRLNENARTGQEMLSSGRLECGFGSSQPDTAATHLRKNSLSVDRGKAVGNTARSEARGDDAPAKATTNSRSTPFSGLDGGGGGSGISGTPFGGEIKPFHRRQGGGSPQTGGGNATGFARKRSKTTPFPANPTSRNRAIAKRNQSLRNSSRPTS